MEQTYLTAVDIVKVRHLQNITIPLSSETRKHLILTGKNGSGKTSVMNALVQHFSYLVKESFYSKPEIERWINLYKQQLPKGVSEAEKQKAQQTQNSIAMWEKELQHWTNGAVTTCTSFATLREKYANGQFILAYYKADRLSKVETSNTIENIPLKDNYALNETPGAQLVKYMVGLKATQAFALQKKDEKRASEIEDWFSRFESVLKKIFEDASLKLEFDIESFKFSILQDNREPFDFNTMSSGYSAVFNIINDLTMRMEKRKDNTTEGIVLIDEIETHLHLELQKIILPFLTELFPNIQFIISTHSPFILSSIDNAVIFDLETKKLVENGLASFPYDGIVEGYFKADKLSNDFRMKLNRYKELTLKLELEDEDYAEIVELENALDEIPDFLSPDIASEYSRLKLEFSDRK